MTDNTLFLSIKNIFTSNMREILRVVTYFFNNKNQIWLLIKDFVVENVIEICH